MVPCGPQCWPAPFTTMTTVSIAILLVDVVTTMHTANKLVIEIVNMVVKGAGQHSGSQGTIVKERCRLISRFTAASLQQVNEKCIEVSLL